MEMWLKGNVFVNIIGRVLKKSFVLEFGLFIIDGKVVLGGKMSLCDVG